MQIAQKKPDDALATLNGVDPGAFAPPFHEVRGDAELAKGDKAGALSEYRAARTHGRQRGGAEQLAARPEDLRSRGRCRAAAASAGTEAPTAQTQATK